MDLFQQTSLIPWLFEGSMVPCIVFSLFFGVAMGAYAKESGNRNIIEWVQGINGVITEHHQNCYERCSNRYLLSVS